MRLNFVHDCTERKLFNDGKKPDYGTLLLVCKVWVLNYQSFSYANPKTS